MCQNQQSSRLRSPDGDQATTVLAPAKLNLFLELLERRADGFHELETVMVPIGLSDRINIRWLSDDSVTTLNGSAIASPSGSSITTDGRSKDSEIQITVDCHWSQLFLDHCNSIEETIRLPESDDNLVTKAVRRFHQRFEMSQGVAITIEKQIPVGGGLGGASSDVANVLAALFYKEKVDPSKWDELLQIATELGSDIPFFLADSPTASEASSARPKGGENQIGPAICRGRGEKIQRIKMNTDHPESPSRFLIAWPGVLLSTPAVYQKAIVPDVTNSPSALLDSLAQRTLNPKFFFNRLSFPARQLCPQIDQTLKVMANAGLDPHVTGSGSTCFAAIPTEIPTEEAPWRDRISSQLPPGSFCTVVAAI